MQMPVCRRLWCLADLHPRHPTATPALKLRLLQSCQSPRQAAFEDLRCLPPPEQRPLPVGKPTDSCSAGHNWSRARKRQRWGPPAPAGKGPPSSCIKGVPGAPRGLTKWAYDQDNLNKGFSVKCPKHGSATTGSIHPDCAVLRTPPGPRTNTAVSSSSSAYANQLRPHPTSRL